MVHCLDAVMCVCTQDGDGEAQPRPDGNTVEVRRGKVRAFSQLVWVESCASGREGRAGARVSMHTL